LDWISALGQDEQEMSKATPFPKANEPNMVEIQKINNN